MSAAVLQMDYLPIEGIAERPASWWSDVLGVACFGKPPPLEGIPVAASMTPSLGAAAEICEVWRVRGAGDRPLTNGTPRDLAGNGCRLHYRFCEDFMFGSVCIEESSLGLFRATMAAYREIFEVIGNDRHLVRVWNYLPDINREDDGDERYRHFNAARQAAFRSCGRPTESGVPAACALGSPAGSPISIYFLAAREAPRMVENPRQMSAYRYPPKFGAYSPSFSRACVLSGWEGTSLFVSGTASIVGCETIHHGDVAAQTRETVANIHALLEETNRIVGASRYSLDGLKLKVYVRRPGDLEAIDGALCASLGAPGPIVYLQADVCREELLVEIEATGQSRAV